MSGRYSGTPEQLQLGCDITLTGGGPGMKYAFLLRRCNTEAGDRVALAIAIGRVARESFKCLTTGWPIPLVRIDKPERVIE